MHKKLCEELFGRQCEIRVESSDRCAVRTENRDKVLGKQMLNLESLTIFHSPENKMIHIITSRLSQRSDLDSHSAAVSPL